MNEALLSAYRWHRRNRSHASRVSMMAAHNALREARVDVANGKARYPSDRIYPAVSWQSEPRKHDAIGTWSNPFPSKPERIGYVDDPARCGLREVGRVMSETGSRNGYWDKRGDCGWHTDPYGDVFKDGTGLCYGMVYQLPGRDGKARFVAGYQFGGTGSGPTIDFSTIYEDDARSYGYPTNARDMDGAIDAARAADSMAQKAAEEDREYQTAWQAGSQWADATQEISDTRTHIRNLIREIRQARAMWTMPTICATLEAALRSHWATIQELRDKRDKLASGDWDSLIFYPSETLRAAFNDGAGETVI